MTSVSNPPYLSIVAVSRNDDHGGNLRRRMQSFLDGLADHCRHHGLDAELVLVEWNPPTESDGLTDALRWPEAGSTPLKARIIRVPESIHRRFAADAPLPLFQMIGKNVGIRNARGEYVLATNIDILFSDPLMSWIASRPLASGKLYRLDRYDVPGDIPEGTAREELLSWCAENAFRIHKRDGLYLRSDAETKVEGSGFRLERPALPVRAFNFFKDEAEACGGTPAGHARALFRVAQKAVRILRAGAALPELHTNACGDFTLLAGEDWQRLRGYPEWPMYSWHLDGLLLYLARKHGITEEAQAPDRCIFHMEHGAGWASERHEELFRKLKDANIPYLTSAVLDRKIEALVHAPQDHTFNGENWGLADENIEEIDLN